MQNNSIKKAVAGIAAVAAASIGLGMAAPAAMADDLSVGNINTSKTGTLTIHKRAQADDNGTHKGSGLEDKSVTGEGIKGVEFTVYPVTGFSWDDANKWGDLDKLSVGTDNKVYTTASGTTALHDPAASIDTANKHVVTTDDSGNVSISGLPLGLYYVVETNNGNSSRQNPQVTGNANPFFVTLPYPTKNDSSASSKNGQWNYDVHVYPKNNVNNVKKTVDVSGAVKVGDEIVWNIDQTVPVLGKDAEGNQIKFTHFGFVDPLDSHTTYESIKVIALDNKLKPISPEEVVPSSYYTLTQDGNTISVDFTKAGLAQLDARKYAAIRFAVTVKVTSLPANYQVPNSVYQWINTPKPSTSGESTPVKSQDQPYYGDYTFKKIDDLTPANPLSGAEFVMWKRTGTTCEQTKPNSGVINADAASNAQGLVKFSGVLIGKFATGTTNDQATAHFCLLETKAPAGYQLNSTVKDFILHAGVNGAGTTENPYDQVKNTKQNGPNLPLTGAAGKLILLLGSVAVLAAAGALFVVNSRRQRANR